MTSNSYEVQKAAEMQQKFSDIVEGILEYYSHVNTYLLGKVWRTLVVNDYSLKVSLFSYYIGKL